MCRLWWLLHVGKFAKKKHGRHIFSVTNRKMLSYANVHNVKYSQHRFATDVGIFFIVYNTTNNPLSKIAYLPLPTTVTILYWICTTPILLILQIQLHWLYIILDNLLWSICNNFIWSDRLCFAFRKFSVAGFVRLFSPKK